jgi:hypothetical protein
MFTAGTRLVRGGGRADSTGTGAGAALGGATETPSDYTIIGGLLVLSALVVYTLMDWRQERAVPPAV